MSAAARGSWGLIQLLGLFAANLTAWAWAWGALGDRPALLGLALLAWTLGLRHAVDADHVAAIDNVVRRQMQAGRRPRLAGLFFALGHSSVVVAASLGAALAAAFFRPQLQAISEAGALVGATVSTLFLLAVAATNGSALPGLWRASVGGSTPGGHSTLSRPVARLVDRTVGGRASSWRMYPLGLLFALGFDTAAEIALVGLSADQAARGLEPWRILVFPALFTAGMTLVDAADNLLMLQVYGRAMHEPSRRARYNLLLTAGSVAAALLIGGLQALDLIREQLHLGGAAWRIVEVATRAAPELGLFMIALCGAAWLLLLTADRRRARFASPPAV